MKIKIISTGIIVLLLLSIKTNARQIQQCTLSELSNRAFNELLTRGMISGEQGTEQYSLIVQGNVKVIAGDGDFTAKVGKNLIIPPNVQNSLVTLEGNTIDIGSFSYRRTDRGDDADDSYTGVFLDTTVVQWDKKVSKPEVFATVDQSVGNIAFTAKGDLVYSHHPFFNPVYRVVIYDAQNKTTRPFPNELWNTPRETDDHYLSNVLGVRNDENGIVWMLDMGQRNPVTPKIVGWNTVTNTLERIYYLPESVITPTSQPNDMVVDTKHGFFVIADEGIGNGGDGSTASLIIVDMKTGKIRRLLEGSRTTLPENIPTMINGKPLAINGKNLLVGCDGITADKDFKELYYAPLNGSKIYRVKMADLLDETLSEVELDKRIETYSAKPNNGGLSIDADGNLYLTAMETNSVDVVLAKDRSVHRLVADENLLWPDGVSYNAVDGYIYVSSAQVHLGAVFHDGKDQSKAPYYIFRFKPLAEGVPFR